jgi:hypothetical protein
MPPTPITSIRDGEHVKVRGRVIPAGELLRAPLTGRPCVAYHLEVSHDDQFPETRIGPAVIEERKAQDFRIADQTGQAVVLVADAKIELVKDRKEIQDLFHDASPELRALLTRHKEPLTSTVMEINRAFCAREGILAEGELVIVEGWAQYRIGELDGNLQTGGYRDAPRQLVITSAPGKPLSIRDE